jgi:hypothetical protein
MTGIVMQVSRAITNIVKKAEQPIVHKTKGWVGRRGIAG